MGESRWHPREDGGAELSVNILAADLLNLGNDLDRLRQTGVRVIHFDLMDGRFCPDLTVGPWFVRAVETDLVKDVHLLVADPENWIDACIDAGAGMITVHVEAGPHVHRALEMITEVAATRERPAPLRGVGICPSTPIEALAPLLEVGDIVYLLGINPGWRQRMLPSTAVRAQAIRELIESSGHEILLAVDGGITVDNFAEVGAMLPHLVVSGSAVFAGGEVESNLAQFAKHGARTGVVQGG